MTDAPKRTVHELATSSPNVARASSAGVGLAVAALIVELISATTGYTMSGVAASSLGVICSTLAGVYLSKMGTE